MTKQKTIPIFGPVSEFFIFTDRRSYLFWAHRMNTVNDAGGSTPYSGLNEEASLENGFYSRLEVCKTLGISWVEV